MYHKKQSIFETDYTRNNPVWKMDYNKQCILKMDYLLTIHVSKCLVDSMRSVKMDSILNNTLLLFDKYKLSNDDKALLC